jgi:hypothetical protein
MNEAPGPTLWRTRFGRGYWPVVGQTKQWMKMVQSADRVLLPSQTRTYKYPTFHTCSAASPALLWPRHEAQTGLRASRCVWTLRHIAVFTNIICQDCTKTNFTACLCHAPILLDLSDYNPTTVTYAGPLSYVVLPRQRSFKSSKSKPRSPANIPKWANEIQALKPLDDREQEEWIQIFIHLPRAGQRHR